MTVSASDIVDRHKTKDNTETYQIGKLKLQLPLTLSAGDLVAHA